MNTASGGPVVGLAEAQFEGFVEEIHGWAPFPWQQALLRRVLAQGWPALIDVPTGLGKTAVLDVAVFASSLGGEHARRRIFLVVDRRLIVDQAHEHAQRIQQALGAAPPGTVCHAAARRLAAGGDVGPALDVTKMRGGVTWSWLWLERPDRHAIVTGTVDQIGSRLLFRGYGIGERQWPIDAALAGTDSLIIVDEAHLSDPFLATVNDIHRLEASGTGRAPVVVAMSASPGRNDADTHRIGTADEQHSEAGKRLTASKRAHLVTVPAAKDAAVAAVADALVYWALQLGRLGQVTGVIVNTVAMARAVFARLQVQLGGPAGLEESACVLLTGRIRPVDREYLLHAWYPRMRAGADHRDARPLFVVATQTIEVGADIDLDGLVTESASLPALLQRLGRVNRRGERAHATAVVVHADSLHDGVYGSARQETWDWLTSLAAPVRHRTGRSLGDFGRGIDASPVGLRHRIRSIPLSEREAMRGAQPYTPLISTVALSTWARTSPVPHPDIPVAPYLHGIGAGEATVSVVWRADAHGDDPQQWQRSTDRLPPSAGEAIELPLGAVRRWLASAPPSRGPDRRSATAAKPETEGSALSDLESHAASTGEPNMPLAGTGLRRRALRYRAGGDCEVVLPGQIQPGDVLVVPARWGGCDRYGWNPASANPVVDVADLAGGGRRAAAVRLGPLLATTIRAVAPSLADPISQLIADIKADIAEDAPDIAAYREQLARVSQVQPSGAGSDALPHERVLAQLARTSRLTVLDGPSAGDGVFAMLTASAITWTEDTSAAGSSVSGTARPITLAAHQAAVRDQARQFARNLGLPDPLTRAVTLAAAHHDDGKRDPRFQVMLHGGDRWRALAAVEPLAKSGMDPADRAAFGLAQQQSGYPAGMRHEALSARIAALLLDGNGDVGTPGVLSARDDDVSGAGVDPDLVIHLIASHHGYGRPLLPPVTDPSPVAVEVVLDGAVKTKLDSADTVDWDGPRRFSRLCERYGLWGLALLEAVVRLADIWCSSRSEEAS
jgi:CRISPR-associated endonuclease/helicase Cas3